MYFKYDGDFRGYIFRWEEFNECEKYVNETPGHPELPVYQIDIQARAVVIGPVMITNRDSEGAGAEAQA